MKVCYRCLAFITSVVACFAITGVNGAYASNKVEGVVQSHFDLTVKFDRQLVLHTEKTEASTTEFKRVAVKRRNNGIFKRKTKHRLPVDRDSRNKFNTTSQPPNKPKKNRNKFTETHKSNK